MGKKKDTEEILIDEVTICESEDTQPMKKLYKYDIGDTVYVMENNKVKEFVVAKRVILTVEGNDGTINEVYYDESNVRSLRGAYKEEQLYSSKKQLLASL